MSPIITDNYGAPQWQGDTGVGIVNINGLQSALDGKASTSHTHGAGSITSGVFATARLGSGTANASKYLRGDGTWADMPTGTAPHSHELSDIAGLQSALDAKASAVNLT